MQVLLAVDHDLIRDTVAAYLRAECRAETEVASDLDAAVAARAAAPDIVVLDLAFAGLDGIARVAAAHPGAPIAVLSAATSRERADAALRAGARGVLTTQMSGRALLDAVGALARGETFVPEGLVSETAVPGDGIQTLTRREMDVLRGVCAGKSNKEIARDLELQEVTVKLHVKTLSRKLGARNRTHAAMIARDAGLM